MSDPKIFSTKRSFIDQFVQPALGEDADDFDLEAIADEMLEHYSPPRDQDPAWRDANRTGFVERQDVNFWQIARRNESTPAAGQGNEGEKQLGKSAASKSYLFDRASSTGVTFGTASGTNLDMSGHMLLVVPVEAVQRIHADGEGLISINPECVAAVRARREEKAQKLRRQVRAGIRSRVADEFDAEYVELENRMAAIERKIEEKVDQVLAAEAGEDVQ